MSIVVSDKNKSGVAAQVAALLNEHNNLSLSYTASKILNSTAVYLPVVVKGLVIASIAVEQRGLIWSEIKHLVVRPQLRGVGLASYLLKETLPKVKAPFIYATIREDNQSSLKVFQKFQFSVVGSTQLLGHNHSVHLLVRQR